MSSGLLRRLRQLNAGLAATPPLPGPRLHAIVDAIAVETDSWQDSRHAEALKSEVLTFGERLRFESGRLREAGDPDPAAIDALLFAACAVLPRGADLLCSLAASAQECFRLASACQLLFTEGVVLLRAQRAFVTLQGPAGAAIQASWHRSVRQQLRAVSHVMHRLPHPSLRPQAAAAFAGSTARPSVLLPWLAEVTKALQWAHPGAATGPAAAGAAQPGSALIYAYSLFLHQVLTEGAYARHAAALASDTPVQQAVVDVLLRRCLPGAADELRADHGIKECVAYTSIVARLVASDCLRTALASEMRQPGAAVRIVSLAASLAAALPVGCPDGMSTDILAAAHAAAALLLAVLCCALLPAQATASGGASASTAAGSSAAVGGITASIHAAAVAAGSEELQAVAAAVLQVLPHQLAVLQSLACNAGCRLPQLGSSSMCDSISGTLESVLGVLGGQASVTPAQVPMWAAAAEAAIRVQPLLAQMHGWQWEEEEEDRGPAVVKRLSEALLQNLWYGMPVGSWELAGEPDAGTFGSLWQLHSSACRLLHWLAADDGEASRHQLAACGGALRAEDWHRLLEGLHTLYSHAHACCIADEAPDQTAQQRAARQRQARALAAGHGEATQACAHAAAAAAAAAEGAASGIGSQQPYAWCQPAASAAQHTQAVIALACVAMASPSLIGPGLVGALEMALGALVQAVNICVDSAQEGPAAYALACALRYILLAARQQPRLAAVLVSRAGTCNVHAAQLADIVWEMMADEKTAVLLVPGYYDACQALVGAGKEASSSLCAAMVEGEGDAAAAPVPGIPNSIQQQQQQQQRGELAAQLETAADQLRQLLDQAGPSSLEIWMPGTQQQGGTIDSTSGSSGSEAHSTSGEEQQGACIPNPAQKLAWLQQLLAQPAAELAVLLQAYWQLPEQQAAAALELAQAAAARSCAHLRCANLALQGGPGTGGGQGCKRCGRCRVARYCSTACSHADWRSGHRRVCEQLAAATAAAEAAAGDAAT